MKQRQAVQPVAGVCAHTVTGNENANIKLVIALKVLHSEFLLHLEIG